MTTDVHVWLDPSCPWAWQTMRWLRDLRPREELVMSYDVFSLEVNAWDREMTYREAAPTYGEALAALVLTARDGGDVAFEALYVALGVRLHDRKEKMTPGLLTSAAADAGLDPAIVTRATGPLFDELGAQVTAAWRSARDADVFGVPTLRIGADKVVYGPILAVGPTGEEGIELWRQIKGLADRDTFFELKRWPRDVRPGDTLHV